MAQKIRRLLSALCFAAVALLCVSSLSQLQADEYQSNWNRGDDYPYEALWVGSSHIYRAIIPQLLYDDYGLETLSLSTASQTSYHAYTTLKDFKGLEKMKLVILDAFSFLRPYTYTPAFNHSLTSTQPELIPEAERQNRYTVSSTAIRQLAETNPLKYMRILGEKEMEVPLQYYFSLFNSHTQYLRMTRSNYESTNARFTRSKNYDFSLYTMPLDDPFENEINPDAVLNAQCREYLLDIIALCKNKNVPLLLTAIPYGASPEELGVLAQLEQIALENGVDYLSMETIVEESMLDWNEDFMDLGHTNHYGAMKVSDFFGYYLSDEYALTDRRDEPSPNSPFLRHPYGYTAVETIETLRRQTPYVTDYLEALYSLDDSYLFLFATDETRGRDLPPESISVLQSLGFAIPDEIPEEGFSLAQIISPSQSRAISTEDTLYASIDAHTFLLNPATGAIQADHQTVSSAAQGSRLVIYDLCDHFAADSLAITQDETIHR